MQSTVATSHTENLLDVTSLSWVTNLFLLLIQIYSCTHILTAYINPISVNTYLENFVTLRAGSNCIYLSVPEHTVTCWVVLNRNKPFRFVCDVEWKSDSQRLNNNDTNLHGLFETISNSSRASSLENLPTIGAIFTFLCDSETCM